MKFLVVIFSFSFMCHVAWALGDPGFLPPNSDAMGSTTATLNQVTEESELDHGTEEREKEEIQEMQESPEEQDKLEERRYDVPDPIKR